MSDVRGVEAAGELYALAAGVLSESRQARPETVRARLTALASAHDDVSIEVVWEAEASDGSRHYDALIRHPSWNGTVSLSFAADDSPPWPLRGVRRWSEEDLLRVNEVTVTVAEAMAYFDAVWDDEELQRKLVDLCLIREELRRRDMTIESDLQAALDRFRVARGLLTAADTAKWMKERGLTHERLELLVAEQAKLERLKDLIAAESGRPADRERAFATWLDSRRANASAEWFWGPEEGTAGSRPGG